jgi:DNA invertase Pin-like site-specific DNA recombinase
MNTYFAYVRVSTVRQGEQGTSPQEQRHAITGYALRHSLEISHWYQESESAAKQGRPEFTRMLREMRRKRPAGIIIHKIDRSARNLKDWASLLEIVDDGVELHFAHESVDLRSRSGRLTANIQAVMAADYSRNLSDEVRKGQLGRLRQGLYPFRAPRGYRNTGPAQLKLVHPVDGPLVRQAFELYAAGGHSIDTLRREMARRGLVQHQGGPLSRGYLTQLLHNPFYMGLMRLPATGELFEGRHEPLVTTELFDRVQRVMAGKGPVKVRKYDFLFRRRAQCAACGRTLTGEIQKGHVYYRCHSPSCHKTTATEAALSLAVRENLLFFVFPDEELRDFREVLQELIEEERATDRERLRQLDRDLAKAAERLSLLTDALLEGTVDRDTYLAKKEALLRLRRIFEDQKRQGAAAPFWTEVAQKFEQSFVALPRYDSAIPDEQRDVLDSMTSNFVVRQKEPEHTLLSPFAEWVEWTKSQDSWDSRAHSRKTTPLRASRKRRIAGFQRFLLSLAPPDIARKRRRGDPRRYDTKPIPPTRRPSARPMDAKRHTPRTGAGTRKPKSVRSGAPQDRHTRGT